ncbi:hypothetical protein [Amycolatopsis sp. CA-230715]|uniref:hypothetical protein n=1 Tax=Amycolatopsis sp. CA-230715 TaxID=2745196 RepID=UPI001C0117C4|nr:hypothetical protein [Amycolatopsis sp. CA-230715]QWF82071.1 hypothetical protein HUW46_05508 [Amycolatopsis sp. CA-230715]
MTLVRAELVKARGTRSMWALAGLAVLFSVAWAVVDVLVFLRSGGTVENAYGMAQQGYLFSLLLGIVLTAGEYRHQTITWTLLVTPRRGEVVRARFAACAVLGLAIGIAGVVVTAPVTAVLLAATGRTVFTPAVPGVLTGSALSVALWCVFGGALGMLAKNQTVAVIGAFVWFLYGDGLLVAFVPSVGRWTPTGASRAVVGWDRGGREVAGDLLPGWAGVLLLLGYAAVAGFAARAISVRRDVT